MLNHLNKNPLFETAKINFCKTLVNSLDFSIDSWFLLPHLWMFLSGIRRRKTTTNCQSWKQHRTIINHKMRQLIDEKAKKLLSIPCTYLPSMWFMNGPIGCAPLPIIVRLAVNVVLLGSNPGTLVLVGIFRKVSGQMLVGITF